MEPRNNWPATNFEHKPAGGTKRNRPRFIFLFLRLPLWFFFHLMNIICSPRDFIGFGRTRMAFIQWVAPDPKFKMKLNPAAIGSTW